MVSTERSHGDLSRGQLGVTGSFFSSSVGLRGFLWERQPAPAQKRAGAVERPELIFTRRQQRLELRPHCHFLSLPAFCYAAGLRRGT